MKIIFFGLGSIGTRHARLLKEHFHHELYAFRSSKNSPKNSLCIPELYTLSNVKKLKPDIAFITNPTSAHLDSALFCAKNKINLFIEKPLSDSEKDIKKLISLAKKNNVAIYVAYCFRFHPVIQYLKEHLKKNKPFHVTINTSSYLPDWRPGRNHLETYSANKTRGGSVILDLSHELDYLCFLLGVPEKPFKGLKVNSYRAGSVTVDTEDFADILLNINNNINNCAVNIHLNFFSRLLRRELVLDFKDHTIIADLISNKITFLNDQKAFKKFRFERDDMFLSQLNYFFNNLRHKDMMNSLEEASKIFEFIMKTKKLAEVKTKK